MYEKNRESKKGWLQIWCFAALRFLVVRAVVSPPPGRIIGGWGRLKTTALWSGEKVASPENEKLKS
jgi:hypothetical protein